MKYLLDTTICIYLIKNQYPEILTKVLKTGFDKIGISTITLAELEFGAANSFRTSETRIALLEFILPFTIFDFNYSAAFYYGKIRKELKVKGQPIGELDMQIAAIALANELIVVTNNEKEFERISGLTFENWRSQHFK